VTLTSLAGVTLMTTVSVAVSPPSSVTFSVSVCAPTASETDAVAPVASDVPPSSHSYVAMLPSRSEDSLPSRFTVSLPSRSESGTVWSGPASASGGRLDRPRLTAS
jgi:hypothetical protein